MGNINLNINNRIERFDEKDVEYKVNYSRRIIIRLILSFLNTDGGMIYIGGTENEYMLELDFAKRTKIDIINTIKNIRPVATNLININIDKRSGKAIVIVNVNKGIHAYYLISENPIYYIRQNGQTSTTTQHKLLRQSHPNEISVYHPEEYKPKNNVFLVLMR